MWSLHVQEAYGCRNSYLDTITGARCGRLQLRRMLSGADVSAPAPQRSTTTTLAAVTATPFVATTAITTAVAAHSSARAVVITVVSRTVAHRTAKCATSSAAGSTATIERGGNERWLDTKRGRYCVCGLWLRLGGDRWLLGLWTLAQEVAEEEQTRADTAGLGATSPRRAAHFPYCPKMLRWCPFPAAQRAASGAHPTGQQTNRYLFHVNRFDGT